MAAEGEDVPTTMKDIKEIEKSLTSSMEKRMDEMRELFTKFREAQTATPSASTSPEDVSLEEIPSEESEGEGKESESKDAKNDPPNKTSPSKGKGEKED